MQTNILCTNKQQELISAETHEQTYDHTLENFSKKANGKDEHEDRGEEKKRFRSGTSFAIAVDAVDTARKLASSRLSRRDRARRGRLGTTDELRNEHNKHTK